MKKTYALFATTLLVAAIPITLLSYYSSTPKRSSAKSLTRDDRAREILRQLPVAMASARSYRFSTTTKAGPGAGQRAVRVSGRYQAPDKTYVVVSGTGYRREIIFAGQRTFARSPEGVWKTATTVGVEADPRQAMVVFAKPLRAEIIGGDATSGQVIINATYKAAGFIPYSPGGSPQARWLSSLEATAKITLDKDTNRLLEANVRLRPRSRHTTTDLRIDIHSTITDYGSAPEVRLPRI